VADPPVDLAEAFRLAGEDAHLLAELVEVFVQDAAERQSALRDALAGGDVPGVERIAHSMKGTAAILGARRLREAAADLEAAATDARMEALAPLHGRFAVELDRVLRFFADPGWQAGLGREGTP
jgi:HPt (histidine-containing phosphotransfer) domain-containing protein